MDTRKRYEIGGEWFTQDELVLYQQEELSVMIGPLANEETTVKGLINNLFNKGLLARALSVVLVPEAGPMPYADVEEHLRHHLKISMQAEIIKDFFDFNASALNAWAEAGKVTTERIGTKAPIFTE